jgi:uncharacterized protein (DUF2147 family)
MARIVKDRRPRGKHRRSLWDPDPWLILDSDTEEFMKRIIITVLLALVGTAFLGADPAAQALGYWKSISDVKGEEGKVTSLWKLSLDAQGQLQGTIVWAPNSKPDDKYTSSKKEYNGLPVRGTFWMKGLKKAGADGWKDGTIVDIGDAKADVYGCEVKVTDGGKKLAMRGYIGFALIGRTQVWEAVSEDDAKKLIGS